MTSKQIIYLVLAIAGAVGTWYFNLAFMQTDGGVVEFVAGGFANAASSSLSMDILIAALAGFVWMVIEAGRIGMKYSWVYILLGVFIAFAFAYPLFLFMRERHLDASQV